MRFQILSLLLAFLPAIHAQSVASSAELIPENSGIAAGKPFTLALKLGHPDDWHSYYRNSGGVEKPPEIAWKLPPGATAGPIQWPVPEVKERYGEKSFVYPGSPVFLIEITPPSTLSTGDAFSIEATAKWQICDPNNCIPETAAFSLAIPVAAEAAPDPAQADLFRDARAAMPAPIPDGITVGTSSADDTLAITVPLSIGKPTEFIPNEPYIKPLSDGGEVSQTGDSYVLTLQRKTTDFLGEDIPQGNTASGILVADETFAIPEVATGGKSVAAAESVSFVKLLGILGGMFIGGLLLNLMPCVFPVIGLKIMGFVQQAGESRNSIAMHGLSFALGVLASFGVLSGILFAIRSAAIRNGTELKGWGYQLQDPWVVLVLMILMFVLALNMFGLFELGTSATSVGGKLQSKSGHAGSFFSGVLATVVATPCSAPFLGAAIGAAIALPAFQFFAAFAAMAIGLSVPYLTLSLAPHLVEKLPRPGAWMESFKQGMSFLLFATAGYLLWVYSRLIGQEFLIGPIFGLSLIAVAAWVYGRWNLPHKPGKTRATAVALATAFAIGGSALALPPTPDKLWQPWSEEAAEKLVSEGTPVYIDFTAQWCFTCQVNKKVAYTEEVLALAEQKGIVFMKADKTAPNPAIEAKLQELGRTAIPVNVLMVPGEEPVITPALLTPGILLDLFGKLPDAEP